MNNRTGGYSESFQSYGAIFLAQHEETIVTIQSQEWVGRGVRIQWSMKYTLPGFLCGLVILNLAGCQGVSTLQAEGALLKEQVQESFDPSGDSSGDSLVNLSGLWEYCQGEVVYELLLDRYGNGPYDWQEGRFETTALSNDQWKGRWVQLGNDREGGLEARLAKDGMSARGRWWYTRIGNDNDPLEPGGEFTLRRTVNSGGKFQGL